MSHPWLKDLEEKVHAASKSLRALREENDELKARVKELEDQIDDLAAAAGSEGGDPGRAEDGSAEAWQKEREEIRERVETLAEHLAGLLGEE
jgi:uncharacterized coiled-coil DUF342 family protein